MRERSFLGWAFTLAFVLPSPDRADASSDGALLMDGLHVAHMNVYSGRYLAPTGVVSWPSKYTYSYNAAKDAYSLEFRRPYPVQAGCLYAYQRSATTAYDTASWDVRSPDAGSSPGGGLCINPPDSGLWEVLFNETDSVPYLVRLRSLQFGECIVSPEETSVNQLVELGPCTSDRGLWEVTPCHCASERDSCLGSYPDAPALYTAAGDLSSPAEQACCLPECADSTTTTISTTITTVTETTEAPLVSADELATAAIAGGVAIGVMCCCFSYWLACHRFSDHIDRNLPERITSSGSFKRYRTFTGSLTPRAMAELPGRFMGTVTQLTPLGARRGRCFPAVAQGEEGRCEPQPEPQPDALHATAWATPAAQPATTAACPPGLARAAALEMADAFVVEYSSLEFQQGLREACQRAQGDLQKEAQERRSLCDPIRFRVISRYGFPPTSEGVDQCLWAFAQLLPGDKELQELNWKLAGLAQTRPQDWETQFVPCCPDMGLERQPPPPPHLSPLGPVVDPAGWERPGVPT